MNEKSKSVTRQMRMEQKLIWTTNTDHISVTSRSAISPAVVDLLELLLFREAVGIAPLLSSYFSPLPPDDAEIPAIFSVRSDFDSIIGALRSAFH